jgi:tryptophan-rich sensory protein
MRDDPMALLGDATEIRRSVAGYRSRVRAVIGLAAFLLGCAGVSLVGAAITATSVGDWYQTIAKPSFNPPDWLFAPIWTTIYILIAVAGWRAWPQAGTAMVSGAFAVYVAQLALNIGWSFLFFGLQKIGLALIEIVVLLAAIAVNIVLFWRLDRWAGVLLVPYLVWVAFATVLTAAIWRLNAN